MYVGICVLRADDVKREEILLLMEQGVWGLQGSDQHSSIFNPVNGHLVALPVESDA